MSCMLRRMNRDAPPAQGGKKKVAASWTCWQHGVAGVLMIVSHSLAPSGSKRGSSDPRLKWKSAMIHFQCFSMGRGPYRPWRSWRSKTSEAMVQNGKRFPNRPPVMFRCISLHTRKSRDGQEDQEGR